MEIKRGDVFYLKYDDSVGRELATGRPAVVLSNTQEILRNDCVVVALLTNTPRSGNVQVSLNDHITYVNVGTNSEPLINIDCIHIKERSRKQKCRKSVENYSTFFL